MEKIKKIYNLKIFFVISIALLWSPIADADSILRVPIDTDYDRVLESVSRQEDVTAFLPPATMEDMKKLQGIFADESRMDAATVAWDLINTGKVNLLEPISPTDVAKARVIAIAVDNSYENIQGSRLQIRQRYDRFSQEMTGKGIRLPSFEKFKKFLMLLTELTYPGSVTESSWPLDAHFPSTPVFLTDIVVKRQSAENRFDIVAVKLKGIFTQHSNTSSDLNLDYVISILRDMPYEHLKALMDLSYRELVDGAEASLKKSLSDIGKLNELIIFFRNNSDLEDSLLAYHNELRSYTYLVESAFQKLQKFLSMKRLIVNGVGHFL